MIKRTFNRRKFFRNFFYALLSLQFIFIFYRLLKPGKRNLSHINLFEAGDISFFEKGKMYPYGSSQFYLYRLKDGGFLAVSSKCTHLGCTVQYNSASHQFECPCHASVFNESGEVLSPPANRALDYYPVSFSNNKVYVDTNQPVRRQRFDNSQVKYA